MKSLLTAIIALSAIPSFAAQCYENINYFAISMDQNKEAIVEKYMDEKHNVSLNAIKGVSYKHGESKSRLMDYLAFGLDKTLSALSIEDCNPDSPAKGDAGSGVFKVEYTSLENKSCSAIVTVKGKVGHNDFSTNYSITLNHDKSFSATCK